LSAVKIRVVLVAFPRGGPTLLLVTAQKEGSREFLHENSPSLSAVSDTVPSALHITGESAVPANRRCGSSAIHHLQNVPAGTATIDIIDRSCSERGRGSSAFGGRIAGELHLTVFARRLPVPTTGVI
jgi:hypothetical protein